MISLIFLQGEKTKSYRTDVREMCSSSTFLKIKGTKELAYFVLIIVMLTSSSFAAPNRPYSIISSEHRQEVRFHNKPCKQVDPEHLQYQMGNFYDSSRMALTKKSVNHKSFDERSIDNMFDNKIDDSVDDYSNDMPYFDTDFDADDIDELSKFEDRSVGGEGYKYDEGSKPDKNSIRYMRRKKRRTEAKFLNDDKEIDKLKSSKNSDEKPQKRLFSDLKKFIRKSKKGKKVKKLPWTCKMKPDWIRLENGYFPPFIYSGSCQSSKKQKCFYNLYDCIPKKYGVKILKRDPNRCNPVPLLGNNTTYEEVWIFDKLDTTVACECGIGKSRKSRHRNRGRP